MPRRVLNDGGPGVTAVSPSNVWIGWDDTTSEHALHWNGHHWLTVTRLAPGGTVKCSSPP